MAGQGLSQISLGPTGPGPQGPNAAMMAIQQMAESQAAQQKKAMDAVLKVQAEGEMRAQQQAMQSQSAMQDVANQVAGGMEKLHAEKKAKEEKTENVRIQQDMSKFQQGLTEDANREIQRVNTLLKTSRDATVAATAAWAEKKENLETDITTGWAKFHALQKNGVFRDIPNGFELADQITADLKSSEAFHEDHFDPSYLSRAAHRLADAERAITTGKNPMDLATFYDTPETADYKDIDADDNLPEVDGEIRNQLSLRDGWPKDGLMPMAPDDPIRKRVRIVTPGLTAKMLLMDVEMSGLMTNEVREQYVRAKMASFKETTGYMSQAAEAQEKVSTMMFARSTGAIGSALTKFTADPRGSKFTDVGENLGLQIISEMFEDKGSEMAQLAKDVRDRTASMDTPNELTAAMHMEAAAAAVEHRIRLLVNVANGNSLGKDKNGELSSMLSQLSDQWAASPQNQKVLVDALGKAAFKDGALTEEGRAKAMFYVQGQLEGAGAWAGELRQSARKMGTWSEFSKQYGTEARAAEIVTFGWLEEHADDKEKARALLFSEDEATAQARYKAEAAGLSGSELEGLQKGVAHGPVRFSDLQKIKIEDSIDTKRSKGVIQNFLAYVNHFNPHELPVAASLLSGGQVDLTDGRVEKFGIATQNAAQLNEYVGLVQSRLTEDRATQRAAKEAQSAGTPWMPEDGLKVRQETEKLQAKRAVELRRLRGQPKSAIQQYSQLAGMAYSNTIRDALTKLRQFTMPAQALGASVKKGIGEMALGFSEGATPQQASPQGGQ